LTTLILFTLVHLGFTPFNTLCAARLMRLSSPAISFAALEMGAVAIQFRACIQRLVIIALIRQARVLAVITAIIAPAGRGTTALRVPAFPSFLSHLIPPQCRLSLWSPPEPFGGQLRRLRRLAAAEETYSCASHSMNFATNTEQGAS
jgi:hypothetical protein